MLDEKAQLLSHSVTPPRRSPWYLLISFPISRPQLLTGWWCDALAEEWGADHFARKKYLAVHVAWSVEQGQFTFNDEQLIVAAGSLQTRYGTPLFLAFEPNREAGKQPWSASLRRREGLSPAIFAFFRHTPPCPEIAKGEIVMMHDHILGDHTDLVAFLKDTPPVAQMWRL